MASLFIIGEASSELSESPSSDDDSERPSSTSFFPLRGDVLPGGESIILAAMS